MEGIGTPVVIDGEHYITLEELRASAPELADSNRFPDVVLAVKREEAEEDWEELARRAWLPRTAQEYCRATGEHVFTHWRDVRAIESATDENGDAIDVSGVVANPIMGALRRPGGWPEGVVNVTYSHGKDAPTAAVKRLVLMLARIYALPSSIDPRATAIINSDVGGYRISVASKETGSCGIPDIDAGAARYGVRTPVGG